MLFKNTATNVNNYASMIKFSHSVFALPFAITGYFFAVAHFEYSFEWLDIIIIILCMVLARNAAMGFNRYADARIDKDNPRTASREIPKGIIKPKAALIFVILNSILFVLVTWSVNKLVFFLSPVALLVVLGYSYTKRFTSLSHFVLGLGLAIAPTAAFLVASGEFRTLPVILSAMVLFWTAGFDIIYSLQDEAFDKKNKLYSIPALAGTKNALILSALSHLISIALLVLIGLLLEGNILFWTGATIFSALLIYQHIIIKPSDISKINLAFGTLNGIASFIFAVFTILSFYINF